MMIIKRWKKMRILVIGLKPRLLRFRRLKIPLLSLLLVRPS
jgi:hypothetical protein